VKTISLERRWLATAVVASVVALAAASAWNVLWAAEERAPEKEGTTQPEVSADAEKAKAAEEPAKVDPFKVPDGSPEELLQYVESLAEERPAEMTFESMSEFRRKLGRAVLEAADKILAGKPTDDQAAEAVRLKVSSLGILASLGDEKAAAQREQLPDELKKNGKKELARLAEGILLESDLRQTRGAGAEELTALVGRLKEYLAEQPLDTADIRLAMTAGQAIEQSGEDKLAAETYGDLAKLFAKSEVEGISDLAKILEGSARRLSLVGNKMHLEGKTLEGKDFDWDGYRGKVVLVDFWATWCGPCRAMLPQLVELHEQYRDRGFDIVGVNLDDEAEAVESFLKENELPWATLFDSHEDAAESMGRYYGIRVIPTTVLVGKDGKVLATNLHGEEINQALAEQLGPVEEGKKGDAEPKETPAGEKPEA